MTILGYVDQIMAREIVGWAADSDASNDRVIVEQQTVLTTAALALYRFAPLFGRPSSCGIVWSTL
jgi:hypothetical protein